MITKKKQADGSVRYQVYSPRNGKKAYVGTYDSQREAEAAERRFLVTQEQIASGELPAELDTKRTLDEALTDWLESLKVRGSRSHAGYTTRVNLYIAPALGSVPIARMNKSHVMRWRDEQAAKFAPATVNGSLTCLSSAFAYFVDRQWSERNPCHGVERIEAPDSVYTWLQTREEITKLLAQCPGEIRDIAAVAVGTGMRLDEVLHLQWADVDIERRLIAVHRGRQGTVKSGKARRVPILDALLPLLRARGLKRGGAELVFPGQPKGLGKERRVMPRSKPGVTAGYKLAVKRAGLSLKLRFHDLRHTFASHWVLDGGDIFRLSKILGHSSVAITQKVYAHLAPEAWEQDYHRVGFHVPDDAPVYEFRRSAAGRIVDRVLTPVRRTETEAPVTIAR